MAKEATDQDISELFRRTELALKDNALNRLAIESHETQCIQKHDTVIRSLAEFKDDFKYFKRWGLGMLTTLLIFCLGVILKGFIV